ncbi:MAG: DNA-binding response regulator [Anaerolineae bacterium CG_4_9_14_3_um_filter_57_17]|nr:response regulator transcription factor [bacterium]NCT19796.1 response regulator transcription factor [bacterium]PJB64297.1 MAG: DNA-binding response regulator [Anaerolineae bacterium CG_4_9_14_3_um_filter_57_17]
MNRVIKLLVVDDHALFRRGLIGLLAEMPEFVVIGEASNGQEALTLLEKVRPDILLLDINMPVMDGIQALISLRKVSPDQKVLMLTISQNDDDLIGAIVAGANGYLLKNTEPEALRETILQVFAGNSVLSPEVTTRVLLTLRRAQSDRGRSLLSEREVDVLRCLARGQTTAQISGALFISENTVKTHIRHILEKMEVNNRAEAVAKASQMNLL